jgi:hypothetical protein
MNPLIQLTLCPHCHRHISAQQLPTDCPLCHRPLGPLVPQPKPVNTFLRLFRMLAVLTAIRSSVILAGIALLAATYKSIPYNIWNAAILSLGSLLGLMEFAALFLFLLIFYHPHPQGKEPNLSLGRPCWGIMVFSGVGFIALLFTQPANPVAKLFLLLFLVARVSLWFLHSLHFMRTLNQESQGHARACIKTTLAITVGVPIFILIGNMLTYLNEETRRTNFIYLLCFAFALDLLGSLLILAGTKTRLKA